MQLGQAAHQRQAEPRAAGLAVEAVVHLVEGREDLLHLVGGNAGTIVAHQYPEIAIGRPPADHLDATAHRGELHGVADQVDQHLLHRALVRPQFGGILVHRDDQRLVLFARLGADQLQGGVEGTCRVQRMGRDIHPAGLDLGDVEQVVDQRQQMRAGGMDVAGIVAVTLIANRPETFLGDDFRKAQDGVQRRAQFVAHVCQEGGLGGVGRFRLEPLLQRLVAGDLQFLRQVLDLEAQACILGHPLHQRRAGDPQLERHERRHNAGDKIDGKVAQQEAQASYRNQGHDRGAIHHHIAAAHDHEAGQDCHAAGGQEQVIDHIAGFPAQPGHQAPGAADQDLRGNKKTGPFFGIFRRPAVAVPGRHRQRTDANRERQYEREGQCAGRGNMADRAIGRQQRNDQAPDRRDQPRQAGGTRHKRQLHHQDARVAFRSVCTPREHAAAFRGN